MQNTRKNSTLGRRAVLQGGAGAMLAALAYRFSESLARADGAPASAASAPASASSPTSFRPPAGSAKAKAVILLWMNGGPSHIDTWDPKPGSRAAGSGKSIKTSVPGVEISEHMPKLAAMANKLAIVRGMTSKEGNHQRAQYLLHTGYAPNPTVQHPSMGGWASKKLGDPKGGLPAFVSIGGPSFGGGFLGVEYGPFVLQKGGDMPQNVGYGPSVDDARFDARARLVDRMDQHFAQQTGDVKVDGRRELYAKAIRMMRSKDLHAFDISDETEAVRASFGDSDFGRGCLVASRLVQAGSRFVEVVLDGWDTHQNNFDRTAKLMGTLDPAMSALTADLERRGLLRNTLVVWMGDFGRTPSINANDGRDHHPAAWSCVLTGAGIRGGVVRGETDANGDKVVKDAVSVPDMSATIASLLGLDPAESFMTPAGRPISISDNGSVVRSILT